MTAQEQFIGLNGLVVTRQEIARVIDAAKKQNDSCVIYRLSRALNKYPEKETFEITIAEFPESGLNAPRHRGSYKVALDDCGRLKPGFRFVGGQIVQAVKKAKKIKALKPKSVSQSNKKEVKKVVPEKKLISVDYNHIKELNLIHDQTWSDVKKSTATTRIQMLRKYDELLHANINKKLKGLLDQGIYEDLKADKKTILIDWLIDNEYFSPATKTERSPSIKYKASVPKVAENQTALFETKKENPKQALRSPIVIPSNLNKNSVAYRRANRGNVEHEYYEIPDQDLSEFFGKVEKKKKESVAITIKGGQGSMKTRLCFRIINALAQNYKVGHASIEEHPESELYEKKVDDYLNAKAQNNLEAPEINTIEDIYRLIENNDVVVIDSFTKIQEMQRGIELDKDFRKKYDGKLFIIIFQETSDGKMRGGSKSQFDGDIICDVYKQPNYEDNYVQANKNRYQSKNLEELKYNIFRGQLEKKAEEIKQETNYKPVKFSFDIIEN